MLIIVIPIVIIGLFYLVYMKTEDGCVVEDIAIMGLLCSIMAVGIMLFLMPFAYIGSGAKKEALETRYEMLSYRYENTVANGDIDYSERELMRDIQDWNESVVKGKALQRDVWIGVFYPNIWDDVEKIELREGVNDE